MIDTNFRCAVGGITFSISLLLAVMASLISAILFFDMLAALSDGKLTVEAFSIASLLITIKTTLLIRRAAAGVIASTRVESENNHHDKESA